MRANREKYMVFDQHRFNLICHDNGRLEFTLLEAMPGAIKSEIENLLHYVNSWETMTLMCQLHHLRGTLSGLGQSHLICMIELLEFSYRLNIPNPSLLKSLLEQLTTLSSEMEDYSKMKLKISN